VQPVTGGTSGKESGLAGCIKNLQKLTLAQFFETTIENGTNIFLTNYEGELATSADTLRSIAEDLEV
jgi:hypothetical protein